MSSIDDGTLRDLIGPLFDVLVATPAPRPPFPMAGDAALDSYYVARPHPAPRRIDFTAPSCDGVDDFEQRLAAYWYASGRRELMAHAWQVSAVARELHALYEQAKPKKEVSPYIYSMF